MYNVFSKPTYIQELSSINQSLKLLQRQNPRWSQAQWHNSRISVQQQNRGNSSVTSTGHWACRYLWGKGQVKEMCLQMFLKGSNWNGWTDRQWQVVPKRRGTKVKSSCTCVGLDPRDWHTIIVVWSQWMEWKWCGKHGVKINRLFFTQGFVGQQIDLTQYSKPYWQPMKGMKQWKIASKWRRLCHQVGQSILNTLKPCTVNVSDTIQKGIAIIQTTGHKSSCK